jgi:hypothetical protein
MLKKIEVVLCMAFSHEDGDSIFLRNVGIQPDIHGATVQMAITKIHIAMTASNATSTEACVFVSSRV